MALRRSLAGLIAFLGVLAGVFSCQSEPESKEPTWLLLSAPSVSVSPDATVVPLIVSSNSAWKLYSVPDWITCDTEGLAGETLLALQIARNTEEFIRSAKMVFTYEDGETILSVKQDAALRLSVTSQKSYQLSSAQTDINVRIAANCIYNITTEADWITLEGADILSGSTHASTGFTADALTFTVQANPYPRERSSCLVFFHGQDLSDTVYVSQRAYVSPYYVDGERVTIQQGPSGASPHLVVLGDGFVKEDLQKENGNYLPVMKQAAEYFFNIEPFASYRDLFSIDVVFAQSNQAGVGDKNHAKVVDNRFGSKYGDGTEVDANIDQCLDFAKACTELEEEPVTVIVVLNDTKYAGTTYLYINGNSIAFCPMSAADSPNDFEGIIHHEVGGHGFGFLADEYVYYDESLPEDEIQDLLYWQEEGYQLNLDVTGSEKACLWADFIGRENYKAVGLFEGGALYKYGVWRSEYNSCMNNNIPYYNLQSRKAIVERVMRLSHRPFNLEDFIRADAAARETAPVYEAPAARPAGWKPLGRPRWIRK